MNDAAGPLGIDPLKAKAKEIADIFGCKFDSTTEPLNSEEDVREVERALGVTLPDSYRAFLLYFNVSFRLIWGDMYIMTGRRSLSGTGDVNWYDELFDPDGNPIELASDLVAMNLDLRGRPSWLAKTKAGDEWWEQQPRWPTHLVQIVHSGSDWCYYLDLSRMDATGECPTIVFPPRPEGGTVATSFVEFLRISREAE